MENKKIEEINIKLDTVVVDHEVRPLKTIRNNYKASNFLRKIGFLWYWYWNLSYKQSWNSYLNEDITWESVLVEDIKSSSHHNVDAEAELTRILNEELNKIPEYKEKMDEINQHNLDLLIKLRDKENKK